MIDAFREKAEHFGLTAIWERENLDFCLRVLKGETDPGYWWTK